MITSQAACEKLKTPGFRISVDGSHRKPGLAQLEPLADFVRFDLSAGDVGRDISRFTDGATPIAIKVDLLRFSPERSIGSK